MCDDCWLKYGEPAIDTPVVRTLADLIERVYEESPVGGALHVVIDDWNIDDQFLDITEGWDGPLTDAEQTCIDALRRATLAERASALALHDGFWG